VKRLKILERRGNRIMYLLVLGAVMN